MPKRLLNNQKPEAGRQYKLQDGTIVEAVAAPGPLCTGCCIDDERCVTTYNSVNCDGLVFAKVGEEEE